MRRRKLWLALVAGLAVSAGVFAFTLWPRADGVTPANYDRIQVGMNAAEVAAVLGRPYDSDPDADIRFAIHFDQGTQPAEFLGRPPGRRPAETIEQRFWPGAAGCVEVGFEEGRAVWKQWAPPATLPHRIQRQWRRWFS